MTILASGGHPSTWILGQGRLNSRRGSKLPLWTSQVSPSSRGSLTAHLDADHRESAQALLPLHVQGRVRDHELQPFLAAPEVALRGEPNVPLQDRVVRVAHGRPPELLEVPAQLRGHLANV